MANNKKSRGQTDWNRVDRLRDADIRAAVKADPNAAPIAGVEWFRHAKLVEPRQKTAISIRLDKDLVQWFRKRGPGYQTRINSVLRAYVESVG